jgi:hypothetical protein
VLAFVDDAADVVRAMSACRTLYRLGRMSPLWQRLTLALGSDGGANPGGLGAWHEDWYARARLAAKPTRPPTERCRRTLAARGGDGPGEKQETERRRCTKAAVGVSAMSLQRKAGRLRTLVAGDAPLLPSMLTAGDVNAGTQVPAVVINSGGWTLKAGTTSFLMICDDKAAVHLITSGCGITQALAERSSLASPSGRCRASHTSRTPSTPPQNSMATRPWPREASLGSGIR